MKLYHGTNYSAAMSICRDGIKLSCSQKYLDFGPGFYTTPDYDHAAVTAIRKTQKYNKKYGTNEEPYVVELEYTYDDKLGLCIKEFTEHDYEWGRFVVSNRLFDYELERFKVREHNQDKRYDIVMGELADASIATLVADIHYEGKSPYEIKVEQLLKGGNKIYGVQYSFHTEKSLGCIDNIECGTIINKKRICEKYNIAM